jgi:hypothetical protein
VPLSTIPFILMPSYSIDNSKVAWWLIVVQENVCECNARDYCSGFELLYAELKYTLKLLLGHFNLRVDLSHNTRAELRY